MKIQDQVCSMQQAKRLKELGVIQKGYFQWQETSNSEPYINHTVFGESSNENEYAAFTVAELGAMLPNGYDTMRTTALNWRTNEWHGYDLDAKDIPDEKGYSTEAECRAAMLIHLLENNHITASEVNQRLQQ